MKYRAGHDTVSFGRACCDIKVDEGYQLFKYHKDSEDLLLHLYN